MSGTQLRIGQVCAQLREEFPDISISKLRFLEERGLVRPDRTAGGYRIYTPEHVRQLRHVLRMQRDEFLPLKVIREELSRRIAETRSERSGEPRRRRLIGEAGEAVRCDEFCQRVGIPPNFVAECMQYDLVHGTRTGGDVTFTPGECELIVTAARLARFGIGVRHLKQVKSAVARQTSLIEQFAAAPLRARNADTRAVALRNLETLTGLLEQFMGQVLVNDVRAIAGDALAPAPPAGVQSDSLSTPRS